MHPNDQYVSEIVKRDEVLEVVEFDTQTRASIIDDIHKDVIENTPPDYMLDILSGAMIALARHAAFRGRGSTVLVPNYEMARSHTTERLMLSGHVIKEKKPVNIFSYELGSLGVTSLVIGPNDDAWDLYYDAHHRVHLIRY